MLVVNLVGQQDSNLHELSALSNPSGWVKLQYSSCVCQFHHAPCAAYAFSSLSRLFL